MQPFVVHLLRSMTDGDILMGFRVVRRVADTANGKVTFATVGFDPITFTIGDRFEVSMVQTPACRSLFGTAINDEVGPAGCRCGCERHGFRPVTPSKPLVPIAEPPAIVRVGFEAFEDLIFKEISLLSVCLEVDVFALLPGLEGGGFKVVT